MPTNPHIENRVIQQLSGNSSAEDDRLVENWLKQSEANRQEYNRLKKAWEAAAIERPIDVEAEWQKFHRRHFHETKVVDMHRPQMQRSRWFSYAAAILLLMGLGLGSWYFAGSNSYHTLSGERLAINLPDGSEVILSSSSELDVPRSFGWWSRNLELRGEAFFDVAHNPEKPFSIEGPATTTQVLGTAFRLVATASENLLEVSEGKVAYRAPQLKKEVIVTAGQKAALKTGSLDKSEIDDPNYDSWKTGRFNFENTPVLEVLASLQNYYHFDVENFEKFSNLNCRFTGSFDRPELSEALEELSLTMGMEYSWDNNSLELQQFHCN